MLFEIAALEWYEKIRKPLKLKTQTDKLDLFQNHIFPVLGQMELHEIKPRHVLTIIHKLDGEGKTRTSRMVRQNICKVFNYSIACEYCENNPTLCITDAMAPHIETNHPSLPVEMIPSFFLKIERDGKLTDQAKRAFILLALTGVRCNELLGAQWSEFHFQNNMWVIPASRMKMKRQHLVPLSKQAVDLLKLQKEVSKDSKYVFCTPQNREKPLHPNSLRKAIYACGYKGLHSLHGFRHLFSTISYESNLWREDAIEMCLAHTIIGVKGVYNKAKYIRERKQLMQWYADFIEHIIKAEYAKHGINLNPPEILKVA